MHIPMPSDDVLGGMSTRISIIFALAIAIILGVVAMYLASYEHTSRSLGIPSTGTMSIANVSKEYCVHSLRLVVLVDNHRDPEKRCEAVWGLSILVEADGHRVLFDTGPDPDILVENAKAMGIDLSRINAVVISHGHGDHVGGLPAIAKINSSIPIYIPKDMGTLVKREIESLGFTNVVEVSRTIEIFPGIFIVGELYGPPYEQALAVNLCGKGLVVVVGCSHPEVDRIVAKAVSDTGIKPYAVVGGFHMVGDPRSYVEKVFSNLKSMGLEIVIPLHCSGATARELAKEMFGFSEDEGHVCSVIVFDS